MVVEALMLMVKEQMSEAGIGSGGGANGNEKLTVVVMATVVVMVTVEVLMEVMEG